ncbi:MAG: PAS domain-containing sensor histidine kinase [Alphaproteobacteria bacterium]|nr:PAS domain-containing sensor histidine kinase [Alphaproteobacteria bacterium]
MSQGLVDYSVLFESMPVPRFIVRSDGLGGYFLIGANRKALQYFDRDRKHVVGYKLEEFLDRDNVRHFRQSFEVCYKHKRSVSIQSLPGLPGGMRVHGFIVSPVIDDQGNIDFLDVIAHADSSDHSMLQRERDDAISLLSSIFDVSEVGIVVSDQNRRIVKVNDSFIRMYGWSREELIGKDVAEMVTPDERDLARNNHDSFIRSGERSSGEMKLIRRDGSIANALFTTATLELSQKRRFQVTTVMDITLRKQMELSLRLAKEQADTANHAKSTFLANMSHELRTPLNAIIGFSEMMKNETFGPLGNEKYKEYLGDIHLSARHLLEIINEVLDMSKIEAGRLELDEAWINLKDLILSVARMSGSRAQNSKLTLIEEVEDGLPALLADMRLVRQILINLVTNALKFSSPGGEIRIGAHLNRDNELVMSVEDQGIGIPRDRIQEALEPFGQVGEPVHARGHQGTGLGLPLAKAMAELHDGSLLLESEVGLGTKVTVTFPAYRTMAENVRRNRSHGEKAQIKLARESE